MGSITFLLLVVAGTAVSQEVNLLNPFLEVKSSIEYLSRDTNLDDPKYRLKDTIQPNYVFVDLDVFLNERRFDGVVTHEVTIRESGLTQIVLHQNVVKISTVSVRNSNNRNVALQTQNPFETDSYYEILKINLASAITAGNYTITVSYLGRINENPVDRGFYLGHYFENNVKRYYATTQFQPYHARKAFPCFDEPQFKSRFTISITRDSYLSKSYSNMAINETQNLGNNRIRETFLPTPIISAYLIAFHVSEFVETNSTSTIAKPFGIISRPGAEYQHAYAASIGLDITNELDDYFAINYYEMGQGQPMKNDHIALPDFPSGAMENWGMVNYREAYLLYDENNMNLPNKITIATIMAHELGHKWFGNLVTCFWWSNLWLNESFASFLEYFAAHWADETLELDDQFVVDYVHSALNWDAFASATPMNWTAVVDNPSVTSHFSTTSYAKGASVLKMMEHFVGWRTFRNALRYYLRTNAYGIGTPEDLYAAFRTAVSEDRTFATRFPNIEVGNVFDTWVQTPGSPVINVNINNNTGVVTLTQERFLVNGQDAAALWQIPISWTHSSNLNFANTTPAFVLTQKSMTVQTQAGNHFVILNIRQSGLYRVNYDNITWGRIAAHLRQNRESIHYLNRAQIVNDVLYFIRAGTINIPRAFDVLDFLKNETNYYVWAGALGQLDLIRRRLIHLPSAHEEFKMYLLGLMNTVINDLGYSERAGDKTSVILNRMQIMNYACNILEHEGCRSYAIGQWNRYRQTPAQQPHVNERRYVFCVGIKEGNAADFDFLLQTYNNTANNAADMVVRLRALGCTNNTASLQRYLEESLYSDKIRVHDKTNAFSFALQGPPENLPVILNFLYTRFLDINVWYGGAARLNIAINAVTTYLTNFQNIVSFQNWLYTNQLALPDSFSTGVSVINSAIANLEWGNSIATEVFAETRKRNSAAAITSPIVLLVVALVAHLLR